MTTGKDSLFRFQGVDFGYVVAGDEAFSLCGKGLSFPPFSVPGIETHSGKCVQLLKNYHSHGLKVIWWVREGGKILGTWESSGEIHSSC